MSAEESPGRPPIYRQLSEEVQQGLALIIGSNSFSEDATLESAFEGIKRLATLIMDGPSAAPQWHVDNLEEQLADARRISSRLAALEGPAVKNLTPTSVLCPGLDRQRSSSACLLGRSSVGSPSRAAVVLLTGAGPVLPTVSGEV